MRLKQQSSPNRRETYLWRIVATGICFVVFGLGGLLIGLVVFPLLLLLVRDPAARRRRARMGVHLAFSAFSRMMQALGGITYEFRGRERLGRPGQLIVANHPTLIDVVLIIAHTPACCVVKAAMFRNPFTRQVVSAAGYVSNSPTDAMIEGAAAALRAGDAVVMFPEGTRTRPGLPREFHRGAASVACQVATLLTPVYIEVQPGLLAKNEPWYRVPARKPHFVLRVGPDVDLDAFRRLPPPKASRALNDWLREHYAEVLGDTDRYNERIMADALPAPRTTAGG